MPTGPVSRRDFFKSVGAAAGVAGIASRLTPMLLRDDAGRDPSGADDAAATG